MIFLFSVNVHATRWGVHDESQPNDEVAAMVRRVRTIGYNTGKYTLRTVRYTIERARGD